MNHSWQNTKNTFTSSLEASIHLWLMKRKIDKTTHGNDSPSFIFSNCITHLTNCPAVTAALGRVCGFWGQSWFYVILCDVFTEERGLKSHLTAHLLSVIKLGIDISNLYGPVFNLQDVNIVCNVTMDMNTQHTARIHRLDILICTDNRQKI